MGLPSTNDPRKNDYQAGADKNRRPKAKCPQLVPS